MRDDTRCSVCGVTADELAAPPRKGGVLLTHFLQGKKRRVEWTICGECEVKEGKAG
jgi:hypothetical protein